MHHSCPIESNTTIIIIVYNKLHENETVKAVRSYTSQYINFLTKILLMIIQYSYSYIAEKFGRSHIYFESIH